ncbi:hypothetical protein ACFLR2_02240 [Chlamydiota bacterium]
MSGTIANQTTASETWQMIEEVNASLAQDKTTQKQGQAQIATGNREAGLAAAIKDVVLPASPDGKLTGTANNPGSAGKPQLSYPSYDSSVFDGADQQQTGLIAIIGEVLALQAKTNSNFWSTLWKQASQSMEMQVKFAPIVGDAIRSQYNAQSQATLAQSNQSYTDAFISFGMFAAAMGTAAFQEFTDPAEEIPNDPATENTDETANAETDADANSPQATEETTQQTDKVLNDEQEVNTSRLRKAWNKISSKLSLGQKRLTGFLGKGMQATQAFGMLSSASTSMNDSKYQNQQAAFQSLEGQAAATSQEAQMYSQFYGQDFTRMEDLRQGSSQNLDYAMNMLQQAANSITQTVTSMFRG